MNRIGGPGVIFAMAGRPREFDVEAARDETMQLFWTQGHKATSLNDLLPAMNLSKSSFYQTLESKDVSKHS